MADSKVTALTELTSFSGDETFYVVEDDDGTPASRRMTIENLAAGLAARSELTSVFAPVAGAVGGPPVIRRKTSDETVTSSTTLQDDNDLTIPVAASEVWVGRVVVFYDAVTAADISLSIDVPSGATLAFSVAGPGATASGDPDVSRFRMRNTAGAFGLGGLGAGTIAVGTIEFYVANSTTPGNIKLQWAQASSNATGTVVKIGSHLTAHRMA